MTIDPTVPGLTAVRAITSSNLRFYLDVVGVDAAIPAATDADAADRADAIAELVRRTNPDHASTSYACWILGQAANELRRHPSETRNDDFALLREGERFDEATDEQYALFARRYGEDEATVRAEVEEAAEADREETEQAD